MSNLEALNVATTHKALRLSPPASTPQPLLKLVYSGQGVDARRPLVRSHLGRMMTDFSDGLDRQIAEILRS